MKRLNYALEQCPSLLTSDSKTLTFEFKKGIKIKVDNDLQIRETKMQSNICKRLTSMTIFLKNIICGGNIWPVLY